MTSPKPWTDLSPAEKRAAVKEMLLAGKSWREIADRLAAPSRNSIANVVTRLRAHGELPPAASKQKTGAAGGALVRAKARKRASSKAAGLAAINIAVCTEHRAEAPGIAISRAAAFDPLPAHEPVPFATNTGCKWPVDGAVGPGLFVCGADRDGHRNYCASHRRLAYTSIQERAA